MSKFGWTENTAFPEIQYGYANSTSAAKPIGACPFCGFLVYEYLAHHCPTNTYLLRQFAYMK